MKDLAASTDQKQKANGHYRSMNYVMALAGALRYLEHRARNQSAIALASICVSQRSEPSTRAMTNYGQFSSKQATTFTVEIVRGISGHTGTMVCNLMWGHEVLWVIRNSSFEILAARTLLFARAKI